MIFTTWTFAAFAVSTLVLYWTIVPPRLRPWYLVVAGAVFYAASVPQYLLLVAALGVTTYTISHRIADEPVRSRRRAWLIAGIVLVAGALCAFKYLSFLAITVDQVSRSRIVPVPHIVVPLAISFFTFEFVHVLVDVYLGKISRLEPLAFAVFTAFFPTLVAGPIKRYGTFAPQVGARRRLDRETVVLNVYRIAIGLAKKCIVADSMTPLTEPLLAPAAAAWGQLDALVAIAAFTVKIYFDFMAYSDIAIGVAGLLGYAIPENFDRPYRSRSIAEFWQRWHISLSSWIRDYVFVPLGGSRRTRVVTARNLLIAMVVVGLWHGAAWTFVAWGVWHGAGLAVHRAWSRSAVAQRASLRSEGIAVRGASVVLTLSFVMCGWALFAAPTPSAAVVTIGRALGMVAPP